MLAVVSIRFSSDGSFLFSQPSTHYNHQSIIQITILSVNILQLLFLLSVSQVKIPSVDHSNHHLVCQYSTVVIPTLSFCKSKSYLSIFQIIILSVNILQSLFLLSVFSKPKSSSSCLHRYLQSLSNNGVPWKCRCATDNSDHPRVYYDDHLQLYPGRSMLDAPRLTLVPAGAAILVPPFIQSQFSITP